MYNIIFDHFRGEKKNKLRVKPQKLFRFFMFYFKSTLYLSTLLFACLMVYKKLLFLDLVWFDEPDKSCHAVGGICKQNLCVFRFTCHLGSTSGGLV